MMRDDIPPPPELTELDEEIVKVLKGVRFRRLTDRILLTLLGTGAVIEAISIALAVSVGGGWTGGATALGIALVLLLFVSMAIMAEMDDGGESERTLNRLRLDRREYLAKRFRNSGLSYARYRESIPDMVDRYRARARLYRRLHYLTQVVVVVGALTASTITAAFGGAPYARLTAVLLTLAGGVSASCSALFRLRERCESLQTVSDETECQYRSSILRIDDYGANQPENELLRTLVERVERLRSEQALKEQLLEQPPDSQRSPVL